MSDKFKVFASPANYQKRLFFNCTYLGGRFFRNSFELYIDLFFINFVFIDKALVPHVLSNKLWKWPICIFCLQIDNNVYSHKWWCTKLSSLFFPLKNHFKGNLCRDQSTMKPIHIGNQQKEKKDSITNSSLSRHFNKFKKISKID